MIWDPQNTLYRVIQRDCIVFGCLEGCFNSSGLYFGMPELLGGVRECFWRLTPWGIQSNWSKLTILAQHQNIKTSLSVISKNDWVLPFFLFFVSVIDKLQFTVSLDHPVELRNFVLINVFSLHLLGPNGENWGFEGVFISFSYTFSRLFKV